MELANITTDLPRLSRVQIRDWLRYIPGVSSPSNVNKPQVREQTCVGELRGALVSGSFRSRSRAGGALSHFLLSAAEVARCSPAFKASAFYDSGTIRVIYPGVQAPAICVGLALEALLRAPPGLGCGFVLRKGEGGRMVILFTIRTTHPPKKNKSLAHESALGKRVSWGTR